MSAVAAHLSESGRAREEPRLRAVPHAPPAEPAGPGAARDLLVPTLDDVASRTWEALLARIPAACIVCGGALEQHTCTSCGSTLE